MSSHNYSSNTYPSIPERGRSVIWAQLTQAQVNAQGTYFREICINCHLYTISLVYIFLLFKNNALKEWSYKKAVTIQTYASYNPIHAPLNILSEFLLLHWWDKKKERRVQKNARRYHDERVKPVTVFILACKTLCPRFQMRTIIEAMSWTDL